MNFGVELITALVVVLVLIFVGFVSAFGGFLYKALQATFNAWSNVDWTDMDSY